MIDDRIRSLLDPRRFPQGLEWFCASDTGTYNSHLIAAASPDYDLFVFEEFPNYHYVGGEIELTGKGNREIAKKLRHAWKFYTQGRRPLRSWADPNTQFRAEYRQYGIQLMVNSLQLELRTEITREYFQNNRIWLAPWLEILPYELEEAHWPEDPTAAGRFQRIKRNDHTLDCLEHICSRRPKGTLRPRGKLPSFLDQFLRDHRLPRSRVDPHLGRL